MLLHLAGNIWPDILFAVHQCARFSQRPKKCHGDAVKRIFCYLKGTCDKGLIFEPSGELTLEALAGADFACLPNFMGCRRTSGCHNLLSTSFHAIHKRNPCNLYLSTNYPYVTPRSNFPDKNFAYSSAVMRQIYYLTKSRLSWNIAVTTPFFRFC